jgi:3-oxoacyl-[acyl-carrier-protein] synthase III
VNFPVGARLIGVGGALPAAVVTNADLERLVDTSDEWITSRTGIKERHIVSKDETATGLMRPGRRLLMPVSIQE